MVVSGQDRQVVRPRGRRYDRIRQLQSMALAGIYDELREHRVGGRNVVNLDARSECIVFRNVFLAQPGEREIFKFAYHGHCNKIGVVEERLNLAIAVKQLNYGVGVQQKAITIHRGCSAGMPQGRRHAI